MSSKNKIDELNEHQIKVSHNLYWGQEWPLAFDDRQLTEEILAEIDRMCTTEPDPIILRACLFSQLKFRKYHFKFYNPNRNRDKTEEEIHLSAMLIDGVYRKLSIKLDEVDSLIATAKLIPGGYLSFTKKKKITEEDPLSTSQKVIAYSFFRELEALPNILTNQQRDKILALLFGRSSDNVKKGMSNMHSNSKWNPFKEDNLLHIASVAEKFSIPLLVEKSKAALKELKNKKRGTKKG